LGETVGVTLATQTPYARWQPLPQKRSLPTGPQTPEALQHCFAAQCAPPAWGPHAPAATGRQDGLGDTPVHAPYAAWQPTPQYAATPAGPHTPKRLQHLPAGQRALASVPHVPSLEIGLGEGRGVDVGDGSGPHLPNPAWQPLPQKRGSPEAPQTPEALQHMPTGHCVPTAAPHLLSVETGSEPLTPQEP